MTRSDSRAATPATRIATWLGGYALVGSLVTLAGWIFRIPRLTDWDWNGISQMPNNAIGVALSGLGVIFIARGWNRTGAVLGAGAALIGLGTLFEYATGIDLNIDRLVAEPDWGQVGTLVPGRMGPPGAVALALIGSSLVFAIAARTRRFAIEGALVTIIIAMLSLVGYLFGAETLYAVPRLTTIALQTSTMLLALGMGLLACIPERQPMRFLLADTAAGSLVRRALPVIVVLPIVIGLLRLRAQDIGLFGTAFGTALLVLALVALFTALLWWSAAAVDRQEQHLRRRTEELRSADGRKNQFLAMLSHELRNPLAPIVSSLEIVKRSPADSGVSERARAIIERQVKHMARLIDDLMDVSRISTDKLTLRRETVDLSAVIRQSAEACATQGAGYLVLLVSEEGTWLISFRW